MIVGLGLNSLWCRSTCGRQTYTVGRPAPTFRETASKIAIFGVVMRSFLYAPATAKRYAALSPFASIIFGNLMALEPDQHQTLGYFYLSHLGYLLVALIAPG